MLGMLDKNPDLLEEILTGAAQLAIKNRSDRDKRQAQGDAAVQLELRVRRRIRNLMDTTRAYEAERRSYELAIRLRDQTFERLVAPRTEVTSSRSPLLKELIEEANEILKVEDRLGGLWTSFRAERLAFYRDLGVLPYKDWSSFIADLYARVCPSARRSRPGWLRPHPRPPTHPPAATMPLRPRRLISAVREPRA